jgi:hypothetical protein
MTAGKVTYQGREIADPRRIRALNKQVRSSQASDTYALAKGAAIPQWQAAQDAEAPTPYDSAVLAQSVGTPETPVDGNPWAEIVRPSSDAAPRENAPGQRSLGDWMREKDASRPEGPEWLSRYMTDAPTPAPIGAIAQETEATRDPIGYFRSIGEEFPDAPNAVAQKRADDIKKTPENKKSGSFWDALANFGERQQQRNAQPQDNTLGYARRG